MILTDERVNEARIIFYVVQKREKNECEQETSNKKRSEAIEMR